MHQAAITPDSESLRATRLDEVAAEVGRLGAAAFKNAEAYPVGSFERRFIEHGAVCYFNCWVMLKQAQGVSSPLPSTTQ